MYFVIGFLFGTIAGIIFMASFEVIADNKPEERTKESGCKYTKRIMCYNNAGKCDSCMIDVLINNYADNVSNELINDLKGVEKNAHN